MSLVWDLECPYKWNGLEFKPGHKYVLIAYADHADHHGKNIYPAIATIAKKTGYEERSVQRLTHELNQMGILLPDGQGPRGTNRWHIPFNERGDKISPLTKSQGDINDKSLGDILSGDIPSGENLTPEFKEPEPNQFNISNKYIKVWDDTKTKLQEEMPRASFDTWVRDTKAVHVEDSILWISTRNDYARNWLNEHLKKRAQELSGLYVNFMTVAESERAEASS